ncbi:hypothetical protein REPUB_Repub04eG0212000 [Reevesia pubescens]
MASCIEERRESSRQPEPQSSSSSPGLKLHADVLFRILRMLSAVDAACFGKACSFWYRISEACQCQPLSTRTLLTLKRLDDSRYQRKKEKQRKRIKTCTTNKRAIKGR